MCTAISENGASLFGRTLDIECSYGEEVVVSPRNFAFDYIYEGTERSHLAFIGVAHMRDGFPLYYDAVNEAGVAIAGLNFPGNACYFDYSPGKRNLASFELAPWLLGQCKTLDSVKKLLSDTNITKDNFHSELPATPLHWLIADKSGCITVEQVSDGLKIYENPLGVLTNNPGFDYHMTHVCDFLHLCAEPPKNSLYPDAQIFPYSRGMGAMGMPGDFSSSSRFVRAVFAKSKAQTASGTGEEVSRFFHLMDTVTVPSGCVVTDNGEPVATVYTSCADTARGVYYFTTYNNRRIRRVDMNSVDLDSSTPVIYSMEDGEDILTLAVK